MKNIFSFDKFQKNINEAEDKAIGSLEEEDEATEDNNDKTPKTELEPGEEMSEIKPEKKSVEFVKRNSNIVSDQFFRELEEHIRYWFEFGKLSEEYELYDVDNKKSYLDFWFNDKEGVFKFKITYKNETLKKVINLEDCYMIFKMYNYQTNELIKTYESKVMIENISSNFIYKKINNIKRKIITSPDNKKDVERFQKKELKNLTDNIY